MLAHSVTVDNELKDLDKTAQEKLFPNLILAKRPKK